MKKTIAALVLVTVCQAAFARGIVSGDDEDAGVCAVMLFLVENRRDDAVRVLARASDREKAFRAGQDFVRYANEYHNEGNKEMFKQMVVDAVLACARHGVRFF